jgi:DNA repair protein RecN (Recombination protein N)
MLLELRVQNLLLIEHAELRLEPGLNAITGETGAGKTVLAHALDLLLGGKPRPGIVRPGADDAYVEGVFAAPPGVLDDDELDDLRARLPDDDAGELVLARRVSAEGRTRAFVQGRSASAADLAQLGSRLVSFYGQHEHRRLTLASVQLRLLDAFCGSDHLALLRRYGESHAKVRTLREQIADLEVRAQASERSRDLLAFELDEIDSLDPSADDEQALQAERARLRGVDALSAASACAAEALSPEDAHTGPPLAEAERLADSVAGTDAQFDALAERLRALALEAADLGADFRRYLAAVEADPERLADVEARIDLYERLKRKHGGDVAGVLAHADRCRSELAALERADDDAGALTAELDRAAGEEAKLAARLTKRRREGASALGDAVRAELAALAMEGASFSAELEPRDELGPAGAERVEFMIAPNPGVPPAPLRDTASGGELSRAMLALLSAARSSDDRTLVFDEVDAGIGGQTARAVGERLRLLAESTQVVCITHLPQIASLARRHFRIQKASSGDLARTSVELLGDDDVVAELCRMLGADASDAGARRHAEELLAVAA